MKMRELICKRCGERLSFKCRVSLYQPCVGWGLEDSGLKRPYQETLTEKNKEEAPKDQNKTPI